MGRARPDPLPVRVPAARGGLGALLDPDGERAAPRSRRCSRPGSRSSTTARRASRRTTSSSSARHRSSRNFFVGAGFNSVGIASAGGAGRALAEWIVERRADHATWSRRHPPVRALQRQQPVAARPGRRGPRPALRGAVAQPRVRPPRGRSAGRRVHAPAGGAERLLRQSKMGWERANFFAPAGRGPGHRVLLGQAELAALVRRRAARHPRGRSRSSTRRRSASYLVAGPRRRGAPAVAVHRRRRRPGRPDRLHRRCSTPAAPTRPTSPSPGSPTTSTCSVSSCRDHRARPDWIRRHVPAGQHARVVDVTSPYAVLGVMGPRSRELLQPALARRPVATTASRSARSREIDLGYATVRATRITYVGELGWELYVPAEFAVGVYEDLMRRGRRSRRRHRRLLRDRRRCGSRRATARSARAHARTTTRSRPACCSPAS